MKAASIIKSFRIHQKTILVFILLMLLVYVVGVFVNLDVQSQIRSELQNSVAMRMSYLAREIDKDVTNLRTQQHQLKVDVKLQKLLLVPNLNDMGMVTGLVNDVCRRVAAIQNSSIYSSEVVVSLSQLKRSLSSSSYYRAQNGEDVKLIRAAAENGTLTIDGDGVYLVENLTQRYKSMSPMGGVCYIRLSLPALRQSLKEASSSSSSNISVYLISGGDVILSEGDGIDAFSAGSLDGKGGVGQISFSIRGRRYLGFRQRIGTLGMDLVACLPEQAITQITMKNQVWMILLTLAAMISFVTFALFANRMINQPINRLVQAFREIEHDNLDVQVDHRASDEFAYLYKAFNNMTQRLKTSIQQVYQHEIATQRAELKQLQSQINPHFLYNSFFHIYRMCKMDDIDGVADFSLKLSSFYQYITRSGQDTVPLEMEYRHAQDYSQIQSVRYGPRIRVFFSPLSDASRGIHVPKLILQPVLENAYLHGSEEREDNTAIYVHAETEGGYLKAVVEDDGSGMNEEDMARLSMLLMDPLISEETTGLINVSRRLHIKYGGQSGVYVNRSAYGGLRVELWILTGEGA